MENDIFKKKILTMYRDIDKVPELELEDYMNYCDKAPANSKDYQSFKMFNEMKEKYGIQGIPDTIFTNDEGKEIGHVLGNMVEDLARRQIDYYLSVCQ